MVKTKVGIILIILLFSVPSFAISEYKQCLNYCDLDRISILDCIQDEKLDWNTENITDWRLARICRRMIKDEKAECRKECFAERIFLELLPPGKHKIPEDYYTN